MTTNRGPAGRPNRLPAQQSAFARLAAEQGVKKPARKPHKVKVQRPRTASRSLFSRLLDRLTKVRRSSNSSRSSFERRTSTASFQPSPVPQAQSFPTRQLQSRSTSFARPTKGTPRTPRKSSATPHGSNHAFCSNYAWAIPNMPFPLARLV
eukprot:5534702-Pleurochrysis_carterae.AAC.4